ncbi:MAG: hypothetical protein CME70_18415 [Halobacteriovorax sp.]|nr:hypothetical protein [Halobacteriovorax sp.]
MSLELRADRISGGEGHFHEIFVDGSPFAGASAVDTSNFVTTGHTGDFVSSWETGNFVSKWETGDHGGITDTSSFVNVSDTGNFVSSWETGNFVSNWETGDHGGIAGGISWSVTPASTGSLGVEGNIAFDSEYMYVCIEDNKWRRSPLSAW